MTVPQELRDILDKKSFWHIATIGPSGAPQTSPVWADFDGTHVKFSLIAGCQKHRNLLANDELSMSALDPDDSYRYLEVRGRVTSIDDDTGLAFINRLSRKYLDVDEYPYLQEGEQPVVVTVEPARTTSLG